ncbi:hypothetical protein [Chromobacterium violaceum]|uniref:hypothetical protein n=1 Tax=Chromobacterium violaceum TaxID=536 RepID=UPI001B338431|nr:hypothetical protein [Chromobacterium violaceum]MBP4046760.1 hypothetical protein [Chromobacterium violaceum]
MIQIGQDHALIALLVHAQRAIIRFDGITISKEVVELLEQLFEQMSREEKSPMCSNGARVEIKM